MSIFFYILFGVFHNRPTNKNINFFRWDFCSKIIVKLHFWKQKLMAKRRKKKKQNRFAVFPIISRKTFFRKPATDFLPAHIKFKLFIVVFQKYSYRQIISSKRNIQCNLRGHGHYVRRNGWILKVHNKPSKLLNFIAMICSKSRQRKSSNPTKISISLFLPLYKFSHKTQAHHFTHWQIQH